MTLILSYEDPENKILDNFIILLLVHFLQQFSLLSQKMRSGPKIIKKKFMLISTEQEISIARKMIIYIIFFPNYKTSLMLCLSY